MKDQLGQSSWRWWISGLLLLATMINYMDRQTLANLSVRITEQFQLKQEQYGDIEFVFGVAFAIGAIVFGIIADRVSVRWLYPGVLLAWSAMGFITGFTQGYTSMLVCRTFLGFFEAGHWPCAMIIIHRVMVRGDRVMGNSILQSGASIGAIVTPLIIRGIVGDNHAPDAWRAPFFIVGGVGLFWAILWFLVVGREDLEAKVEGPVEPKRPPLFWLLDFLREPRFYALFTTVISINISWQLIRAWLPKFLQEGRGYSEAEALYFNSAYYISTDVGCLLAGAVAMWMSRKGVSVLRSRLLVFACCALLTSLTTLAAFLPHGWLLLGVLLLVAAGSLGLFPCYYSFVQELSKTHVGKASGILGFSAWMVTSPLQKLFGRLVDQTGSFDLPMALVGWAPMIGLIALLTLWREPVKEGEA